MPAMLKVLVTLVFSAALLACSKGAGGKCNVDGDCKSGRNCWCEQNVRSPDGSCGPIGKEKLGTCLSEAEAAKKK
jgi:hypothetical protein